VSNQPFSQEIKKEKKSKIFEKNKNMTFGEE